MKERFKEEDFFVSTKEEESKEMEEFLREMLWHEIKKPDFNPCKIDFLRKHRESKIGLSNKHSGGKAGKRGTQILARSNFLTVAVFIGFGEAKKLMALTRRGFLYIPAKQNSEIIKATSEQAGEILRSRAFRFVFDADKYGLGSPLRIEYPKTLCVSKSESIARRLAVIDFSISSLYEVAKSLPQTQAEKAKYFGVSQPRISNFQKRKEYREIIERGASAITCNGVREILKREAVLNRDNFYETYSRIFSKIVVKQIYDNICA